MRNWCVLHKAIVKKKYTTNNWGGSKNSEINVMRVCGDSDDNPKAHHHKYKITQTGGRWAVVYVTRKEYREDVRDGMGCTDVNVMGFWNNNTHMSQEECSESGS